MLTDIVVQTGKESQALLIEGQGPDSEKKPGDATDGLILKIESYAAELHKLIDQLYFGSKENKNHQG